MSTTQHPPSHLRDASYDNDHQGTAMQRPAIIESVFELPGNGPPVLATGSQANNTLCITAQDKAYLSHSLGNLDSAVACTNHEVAATELMVWQATIPAIVARDLDPDIHAARFAIELAANLGVPNIAVQHHHAHVAAVCADHGLLDPVLGLVLDAPGLGTDGASWGGELLWVHGDKFERHSHFVPIAKPGGDIVLRETWRLAASVLHRLHRLDDVKRRYSVHPASADLMSMLDEARNCPVTSSAALLMAAAANLLRIDTSGGIDAIGTRLEEAAMRYFCDDYIPVPEMLWQIDSDGCLDFYPLLAMLVDEFDVEHGAAAFHANLILGITEWVTDACLKRNTRHVVMAGSCMRNSLLVAGLRNNLERRGFAVFEPQRISPDDSSIALGQAWIARLSLKRA